ncbi:SRR1-like protein [Ptychodera flava]|uniref:SRR1-like protein n=1 Tax=Ptychodera flava TaxID=63121 RepID=UPI003969E9AE
MSHSQDKHDFSKVFKRFRIVFERGKSKSKKRIASKISAGELLDNSCVSHDEINVEKLRRHIRECRTEISLSGFYEHFKKTLQSACKCLKQKQQQNKNTEDSTVESNTSSQICQDDQEKQESNTLEDKCFFNENQIFKHDELQGIDLEERISSKPSHCHHFHIVDIVCYGLGNFSSCPIARHQFALLLLLKDFLQILYPQIPGQCYSYDPRFTTQERDVLHEMGIICIKENEEGKRPVHQPTLFYMPHCGKPLYNNLLWSNWTLSQMRDVIIIGNSFDSYRTRLPSKQFTEEVPYISRILPYTKEFALDVSSSYSEIFTDTSIHVFSDQKLSDVPDEFWQDAAEPVYRNLDDLEIILKR